MSFTSCASVSTVGNFWVDITRCTPYILLPICIVHTLFLVWQGIRQTLGPYVDATTLEGAKQTIAVGPVSRTRQREAAHRFVAALASDGGNVSARLRGPPSRSVTEFQLRSRAPGACC